jgi:hypothetical protein
MPIARSTMTTRIATTARTNDTPNAANPTDDRHAGCLDALAREAAALVEALDRDPLVGAVIRGEASRAAYVHFLRGTYHYIRWSGPLLAETAAGMRRRPGAGCRWLIELLDAKTSEEAAHDLWVLADLRRLGENVELLKAASPPPAVVAYVAHSRSLAEAGSAGYLGAAYVLELISARRAGRAARNLRVGAGIAGIEDALSFLEGHADADTGHVAVLEGVLRRIDDPQDQDDLWLAAKQLRRLYPLFFVPERGEPPAAAAAGSGS